MAPRLRQSRPRLRAVRRPRVRHADEAKVQTSRLLTRCSKAAPFGARFCMVHGWEVAPGPGTLFVIREPRCRFSGSISTTRLGSNEDRPLGFREQMTGVDEERIHAAMQIIGEGIGMETFCGALRDRRRRAPAPARDGPSASCGLRWRPGDSVHRRHQEQAHGAPARARKRKRICFSRLAGTRSRKRICYSRPARAGASQLKSGDLPALPRGPGSSWPGPYPPRLRAFARRDSETDGDRGPLLPRFILSSPRNPIDGRTSGDWRLRRCES